MKELIEEITERARKNYITYIYTANRYYLGRTREAIFILEKLKALQNSEHDKTN